MKPARWLAALIACIASTLAAAADAVDYKAERERIGRERTEVEARFDAERRACESRFAVTACLDQAKSRRRTSLEELGQRRNLLDDQQRRERASARQREIEERLHDRDSRDAAPKLEVKVRKPRAAASHPAASRAAPTHPQASGSRSPGFRASGPGPAQAPSADEQNSAADQQGQRPVSAAEERAAAEKRSRLAYERRAREAAEHKAAVERRNAERATRHASAAASGAGR